jgi:hypothetical protein
MLSQLAGGDEEVNQSLLNMLAGRQKVGHVVLCLATLLDHSSSPDNSMCLMKQSSSDSVWKLTSLSEDWIYLSGPVCACVH